MRAMVVRRPGSGRLVPVERAAPEPAPGQVRIRVTACGVCRTDLHVLDGDLPDPKPDVIPGHEIVGRIDRLGDSVQGFAVGDRVGVPWLAGSCTTCLHCSRGRENLCRDARYTGYQVDGGFAEYAVSDARYTFPLPGQGDDAELAPLLCAGLIGYRAYRLALDSAPEARAVGLYGFGAAAHILAQVAAHDRREVYAFVRPGDEDSAAFARGLGVRWAGPSDAPAPVELDAAILFAPVGALVPAALRAVARGGVVVCAGIHMSDIPGFPYRLLWEERVLRSVANLTRRDAVDFLALAPQVPVQTHVARYALAEAQCAVDDLRAGRVQGAAVLIPDADAREFAPRS